VLEASVGPRYALFNSILGLGQTACFRGRDHGGIAPRGQIAVTIVSISGSAAIQSSRLGGNIIYNDRLFV
jgi:hypothetical protein